MTEAAPFRGSNDQIAQAMGQIAEQALQAMESISAHAGAQAQRGEAGSVSAMGALNGFNSPEVGRALGKIQSQEQRAAYDIQNEPFIARVKVQTQSGEEQVYYFGRNFAVNPPGIRMAGYTSDAPVARLAALEIGDPFRLPNGQEVEVIETGRYAPRQMREGWDGVNSSIALAAQEPFFVPSLRAVLQVGATALDDDPLAAYDQPVVWARPRRQSLKGTGLRNETILNKVQDEIFRLPMSRQVMLEGPPGTGKTSTLIKRLAQKLALTKDSIEDFRLVEENSLGVAHRDSWIMFSPTQLLEHYLVQAFADNNVPSGQKRVQTWADFRNDLATRVLGLLRSGGRKTGFLREEYEPYLSPGAMEDQPGLHAALDRFLAETSRAELDGALGLLTTSGETALVDAAQRIVNRLPAGFSILAIHLAVDAQSDALRNWVNGARAALMTDVARWIDVVARRRSADIPALREIVARMNASDTDSDEDEDEDDGLEPEAAPTTTGESLRRALRGAIRAQAMAAWTGRAVTRTSIFRPVIDWLGEQAVAEADLRAMGRLHALIAAAGRVTLVTRNHFTKLPMRYRAFRRAMPLPWFLPNAAEAQKLTYDELDLLVAIHLEAAHQLMSSPQVRGNLTQGNLQVLAPLRAEFRNQVVVDEATDFSALQLRAMASLATPGIRSFFACGDFNQRLTAHGVAGQAALEWAVPGIEFHEVAVSYRQSEELRGFANRLIGLAGGKLRAVEGAGEAAGDRGKAGYVPAFHLATDALDQSRWIAERIEEISQLHDDLPSIAVFVPDEPMVDTVAAQLRAALSETNIDVMACPGGKVLGRDHHVRVFSVGHIKGLEFESAFFHSVHRLAADQPELFDKFLYVGATRAATFLGLSASGDLPPLVAQVVQGLPEQWSVQQ